MVRAPVAIINFAFFLCGASLLNPMQTQRFLQGFDAKLIIATGARTTPVIEISPLTKTPLWKPLIRVPEPNPFFANRALGDWNIASRRFEAIRANRSNVMKLQRRRDDNKNKICTFEGGQPWGQRGKSTKNAIFRGNRHDNQILKVDILLSRNFCCH